MLRAMFPGRQLSLLPAEDILVSVRSLSSEDRSLVPYDALGDVVVECFGEPPWNECWTQKKAAAFLRRSTEGDFDLFTAALSRSPDREEIVGFGLGMPLAGYGDQGRVVEGGSPVESYYLFALATRAQYRRLGIGTELLHRLIHCGRSRGFRTVSARTHAENYAMLRVSRRFGLEVVGTYVVTIRNTPSRRVVLVQR